ncbi:hypothetical protein [Pseudoalteromonas sp. JC3]|uniref:hypothetical protein n=1 Tax=Pseudoalteromonas sp. JC3 TaxID=2810196 RepID=UPI0019D224B2|nr:hypothetical protein [Pseudoalteromonas sp. JC3]MBR8843040.1 hypothetical protein [Pseudoalteromonas sp. JC3]WJE10734.1 hypothetical protein QSH61_21850 [Pseudoalteromonas sp. JC3]
MNIPSIELVLANTNATVVRQKLPRTTYGSKDAIIQIIRDAVDMEESIRNIYAFALEGRPGACRDSYLAFLVEYQNDHFDFFDDSEMNMGNTSREYEVISIVQHMSLLANPNHLLYSVKRLPYQLRDLPPLQAACLVKSQSFKPLLPNWQTFLATFNKGQQLSPKSSYQAGDWEALYDESKAALRSINVCSIHQFIGNLPEYEQLNLGMMRGHEFRVFISTKGNECQICFVPVDSAYTVYQQIENHLTEFVYGDFLPESIVRSAGQRLLSLNKTELIPASQDNLHWVFRKYPA